MLRRCYEETVPVNKLTQMDDDGDVKYKLLSAV